MKRQMRFKGANDIKPYPSSCPLSATFSHFSSPACLCLPASFCLSLFLSLSPVLRWLLAYFRLQSSSVCEPNLSMDLQAERVRDGGIERARDSEWVKKNHVKWDSALCCQSLPLHLCSNNHGQHFLQIWSCRQLFVQKLYVTIILINLFKLTAIITIINSFDELFICIWSFLLKQILLWNLQELSLITPTFDINGKYSQ